MENILHLSHAHNRRLKNSCSFCNMCPLYTLINGLIFAIPFLLFLPYFISNSACSLFIWKNSDSQQNNTTSKYLFMRVFARQLEGWYCIKDQRRMLSFMSEGIFKLAYFMAQINQDLNLRLNIDWLACHSTSTSSSTSRSY